MTEPMEATAQVNITFKKAIIVDILLLLLLLCAFLAGYWYGEKKMGESAKEFIKDYCTCETETVIYPGHAQNTNYLFGNFGNAST